MNKGKGKSSQKRWNKVVMTLMALALVVFMVPMTAKAENVTTGTLGDNNGITWSYDAETKTLTLTGNDSGWEGVVDTEYGYSGVAVSRLKGIVNEEFKHIVVENCTIKGSAESMFAYLTGVESIEFKNVNTSNVTSMKCMFQSCDSLDNLDLSGFDTSNVTDMYGMFCSKSLTSVNVNGFDTSKVTDMTCLFSGCKSLKSVDLSSFDTLNVTSMWCMFEGCSNLRSVKLGTFDTKKVTSMGYMFRDCGKLEEVDVSRFNTSSLKDTRSMFYGCTSLEEIDVSGFDTSKIKDMAYMFYGCSSLISVDLSNFDLSTSTGWLNPGTGINDMFTGCKNLKKVVTPKKMIEGQTTGLPHVFCTPGGQTTTEITNAYCNMVLTAENPFGDITPDSWQYKATKYVYDNGLMTGKGKDANGYIIFDPNKSIPREEFVQVLYNASGKPAVNVENIFPDVKNAWYKNAVLWAYENNIAKGKGNGDFGVTESISRQDLALMLYKYASLKGYDLSANAGEINKYADGNKVSSYAKTAMDWAVSKGIMSGKGAKGEPISTFKLDPTGTATRAECAAMLMNFMEAY